VQSWVESVAATSAMAASSDDPPPGTGWLEICKNADPTGPVSGPFTFTCDVRPAGQARQRVLPRDQGRRWGPDGRVRLSELGRRGALIGRITLVVGTGKETVRLPFVVARRGSGLRHDGHLDAADGAGRRGAQGTATAG
jgi:hypothetical protein